MMINSLPQIAHQWGVEFTNDIHAEVHNIFGPYRPHNADICIIAIGRLIQRINHLEKQMQILIDEKGATGDERFK